MDSRIPAWGRLSRAIVVRVILFCLLATVVVQLLASTHLYATAIILGGLSVVAVYDLTRLLGRVQREFGRMLEAATAASRTDKAQASIGSAQASFQWTAEQPPADQLRRERQLQFTEALLDTVSSALFVIREDDTSILANRSARRLAGQAVSSLSQVAALGNATATLMQEMQPGARYVAYLADGQPVYVSAAEFRIAGEGRHRLISLQRMVGELDAIEVKAWQDVAAVLTHEMMNSLTPIASLSENLEELLRDAQRTQSMDPTIIELSGALEAIKRRSHGLMNFVERYRAVSELPRPDLQPVDLKRLVAAIDRLMSTLLQEAGVAYTCRLDASASSILADVSLLEQAVINLIRNAAEAAVDEDAPAVTVTCESHDGEVVIAIADNGPGLSEQQRERIFVPFYTTKPNGSGIGLSLARQIAFAHRGRIDVHPNQPKGSVFSIVLPEARAPLSHSS
jgi:two-component system, NtrC family, nitrogen regulation sensor histidine kinase NtrY